MSENNISSGAEKADSLTARNKNHGKNHSRRRERGERRRRAKGGFGGWLAAVISLGAVTLALGAALTYTLIASNGLRADMASNITYNVYELSSVLDNLDGNLAKASVATSKREQAKILSDIAVESELAEAILERMPLECQSCEKLTSFINKMGDSAKGMLIDIASGKGLSDSQKAALEYMYATNMQLKTAINGVACKTCPKDMLKSLKGEGGILQSSFEDLENMSYQTPTEIQDGPFAENKRGLNAKALEGLEEISATQAEERAKEYFANYGFEGVTCTGECTLNGFSAYNIALSSKDGEAYAQISKKGGRVILFDSFKECSEKNFSVERCIDIAEDFLKELGYSRLTAVWTSENTTTCNLNFVATCGDTLIYPDMIKVKVCEERGIVTGVEALAYNLNHVERSLQRAKITPEQAMGRMNSELSADSCKLAVIDLDGKELLCYELIAEGDSGIYYIYIDANTGEQAQTLVQINTKQGKALI